MSFAWLDAPLIKILGHHISMLGIIAFVGFLSAGLLAAKILQSDSIRRLFGRLKLEANFIAIVTTILSCSPRPLD